MCSNILEYTRSSCSNTWKRVTKALFRYFVSSTKLLATGNLARDGLIKVVSVYCGICTLYYRYRSDTDTTGIDIDTDIGISIGPPLIKWYISTV